MDLLHSARTVAASLLLWLAGCTDAADLPPLAGTDVILAFGDSLTHGTGAGPGQGYPARLACRLGLTVINAGVPGELSRQGVERLPELLARHRPALVVLCHGGNDILRRQPMPALEAALRDMVTQARAAGADVVMLGVPGFNLGLSPPAVYQRVAEDLDVPLDAQTIPELMRDRTLKSDRVHFNAEGYAQLADAVYTLLEIRGALSVVVAD